MYRKTIAEHARHWNALKKFERNFVAARGPNPNLPAWGAHPRSGAIWSHEENLALVENFKGQVHAVTTPLGFKGLCEIAYLHGRSATAVEAQLKKVLGWKTFHKHFMM